MKICVTGLRGIPNIMGGIETHCQQLYQRLALLDPSLEILVFGRTPYTGAKSYSWMGIKVSPVWTLRNKYLETILHTLLCIFFARFVERADTMHIHGIGPGLLTPLARLLGLKVVLTHHGQDYRRAKWGSFARGVLRLGEAVAVRSSNAVICVSKSNNEELIRRFPTQASNLHYVPNGAALPKTEANSDAILTELGITNGEYILSVGRLVEEKGFQDLIAARLKAQTRLKVVIVGAADHEDRFATKLKGYASDTIIFAGMRNSSELGTLYRSAALFVLPSYHEGLPIVALEALNAQAPVLLSNIPQNVDIGLPSQCYFPLGDIDALAERISARSFELLRADISDLPTSFDWDKIAVETLSIIQLQCGLSSEATA
jgi:glycosyltransferase involved in cell wall biosynthesis